MLGITVIIICYSKRGYSVGWYGVITGILTLGLGFQGERGLGKFNGEVVPETDVKRDHLKLRDGGRGATVGY